MNIWRPPIKAKVFEAFGALADHRVVLKTDQQAEVTSSGLDQKYVVKWDRDRKAFSSNDNASRWQGTIGYQIIAVLLELNVLKYDGSIAGQLAGIKWKTLNDQAKRDYDLVIQNVLSGIEVNGGDRARIELEVDRIHDQLLELKLQKLTPGGNT